MSAGSSTDGSLLAHLNEASEGFGAQGTGPLATKDHLVIIRIAAVRDLGNSTNRRTP